MTKLTIRDYEPEDFLDIELMDYERECRKGQPVAEWAVFKKHAGPAATVEDPEGRIVFICGIHNMWPGVGEAWAVISPLARKYLYLVIVAKEAFKFNQNGQELEQFKERFLATYNMEYKIKEVGKLFTGYVRIQAAIDPTYPEAVRAVEYVGFKPEGRMHRYGPHGEDRILYALVKERKDGE